MEVISLSKRIIAILAVVTIVFVCVFAACGKQDGVYADEKDFEFVTDENGEKVLAENGQFVVYATDENGKYVTDINGEKETMLQQFQPLENDGVIEDYGFKLTLPDGWKVNESEFGKFENKKNKQNCEISIVKYYYSDYYDMNKSFYNKLVKEKEAVTWEDNIALGETFENTCRFTVKKDGNASIMYFFENSGNVYKVLFSGTDSDTFIADTEAFCKSMEFKNVQYYDDITSMSEKKK